jgi:hypothetical protein
MRQYDCHPDCRCAAERNPFRFLSSIDDDAQQPVGENLARAHAPELFERFPGCEVLAVANERFQFLQRELKCF